jgi:hypothetical protein
MKRFGRRLLKGLLLAALPATALLVAAWVWWIPSAVQSKIQAKIAPYWDGTISIRTAMFLDRGTLQLRGVSLRDASGREWLHVDFVRLTSKDFLAANAAVVSADADGVQATVYPEKLVRPKIAPPSSPAGEDFSSASINNLAVTTVDDEGERTKALEAQATLTRVADALHCSLTCTVNDSPTPLEISADVKSGEDGRVVVENGSVWLQQRPLASSLHAGIHGEEDGIEIPDLTAKVCSGQFRGSLAKYNTANGPRLGGDLSLMDAGLREVLETLGSESRYNGRLSARFSFALNDNDLDTFRGNGWVFLREADVRTSGLVWELHRLLGLTRRDSLNRTDIEVLFHLKYPLAVIDKAHLADDVAALDVEPGGTINLDTRQMDFYVVGALLRKNRSVLPSAIPFVPLLTDLTENFARLRVTGPWNDSARMKISVEPLKKLKDTTAIFFQHTAAAGGHLEGALQATVGHLLNLLPQPTKTK